MENIYTAAARQHYNTTRPGIFGGAYYVIVKPLGEQAKATLAKSKGQVVLEDDYGILFWGKKPDLSATVCRCFNPN